MVAESLMLDTTGGNYQYNVVYPYPWNPIVNPTWIPTPTTFTWPSSDGPRIAALEARLARLECENRRLKHGLGRLYRERRQQQEQTEAE